MLTQFSVPFLSMWSNHLSCICHLTAELSQPVLYFSEVLCSDRLVLPIHLDNCISVGWSLQMSSILASQVSLPYKFLWQTLQILAFILCENNLDIKGGSNSLNFFQSVFQPVLIWFIELSSAPPPRLSISPSYQNLSSLL